MSAVKKLQVLSLYKDLLRYGQQLQYTDKQYFYNRIREEFQQNKTLTDPKDINFHLQKGLALLEKQLSIRLKHNVDYSKVPQLHESDLQEQFVRGSGPGGQATNKTSNCVVLKHLPSGIVVKCHENRSLQQNRKKARTILLSKLDNLINQEDSVENQIKAIDRKKLISSEQKKQKLKTMKENWKERENIK